MLLSCSPIFAFDEFSGFKFKNKMNYTAFVLVILGCCYTIITATDTGNGNPYMWLLIRQLERTTEDLKKLEGQIQEINTKVDLSGKHLEGLRDDVDKLKSQMDNKIGQALKPINEKLQIIQLQSDKVKQSVQAASGNNENRLKAIATKLNLLENSIERLKKYHDNTHKGIKECPTTWKTWNGHCYFFSSETLTWDQAKLKCSGKRSHLVKIENSQENNMLVTEVRKLGGAFYWFGANDINREGEWKWYVDNTPLQYSNWAYGEPNDMSKSEDCGTFYRTSGYYMWNDFPCNGKGYFICEKKLSL